MANDWNRYGPTAARPTGKPGRAARPKSVTVDLHSHIAIPEAAEFIKPHLDLATIPLAHFATPETKAIGVRQDADRRSRMVGYDERLADRGPDLLPRVELGVFSRLGLAGARQDGPALVVEAELVQCPVSAHGSTRSNPPQHQPPRRYVGHCYHRSL